MDLRYSDLNMQEKEAVSLALKKFQTLNGKELGDEELREIANFFLEQGISNGECFKMLLSKLQEVPKDELSQEIIKESKSRNEINNKKDEYFFIKICIIILIIISGYIYLKTNPETKFNPISYFQHSSTFSIKEQNYFRNNYGKFLNGDVDFEIDNETINSNIMEIKATVRYKDFNGAKIYIGITKNKGIYNLKMYIAGLAFVDLYSTNFDFLDEKNLKKQEFKFTQSEMSMLEEYKENLYKNYGESLNNSYDLFFKSILGFSDSSNLYYIIHISKIDENDLKNSIVYSTTIEKNKDGFVALNKDGIIAKNESLEELLKNPQIFPVTSEMINEAKKNNIEFSNSLLESFKEADGFDYNQENSNQIVDDGWNTDNLNSELKEFQSPITQFKTNSYIIRIDKMSNEYYRMAIWEKGASISEVPSWLLMKGVLIVDGYGNKFIEFINSNNEEFICLFNENKKPIVFQYYDSKALEEDGGSPEPTIYQDVIEYNYSYLN